MKRQLTLLAILLVTLVVLRLYSQSTEFFEDAKGAGPVVVIAKAEWCGHCKAAAPEFQKLKEASPIRLQNGKMATVKVLDADSDKDEINALPQKVRGYPTIMVLNGSEVKEYPGERTMDGVVTFLNML